MSQKIPRFIISNKASLEASTMSFVLPNPTTYKTDKYNITNMARLANGLMVGDLIARKKKFYFTWDALTGNALQIITNAVYDMPAIFFYLHEMHDDGTLHTYSVYAGSLTQNLHRAGMNKANWVWKDVTVDLIER